MCQRVKLVLYVASFATAGAIQHAAKESCLFYFPTSSLAMEAYNIALNNFRSLGKVKDDLIILDERETCPGCNALVTRLDIFEDTVAALADASFNAIDNVSKEFRVKFEEQQMQLKFLISKEAEREAKLKFKVFQLALQDFYKIDEKFRELVSPSLRPQLEDNRNERNVQCHLFLREDKPEVVQYKITDLNHKLRNLSAEVKAIIAKKFPKPADSPNGLLEEWLAYLDQTYPITKDLNEAGCDMEAVLLSSTVNHIESFWDLD